MSMATNAANMPKFCAPLIEGSGYAMQNDNNIVYIFAQLGQSNGAAGSDQEDSILANTVLFPGHQLAPPIGPRCGPGYFGSLADLREVADGLQKESAVTSTVTHLIKNISDHLGVMPRIAAFNCSIGAKILPQLKCGTESFSYFISALYNTTNCIRAAGLRPVFLAANYMGNEGMVMTPPNFFAGMLLQLRRDLELVVKKIIPDQSEDWILYLDTVRTVATELPLENRQVAGLEAAQLRHPLIRMSHPNYANSGSGNRVHLDCRGQNQRGQALARAIFHEQFGLGWQHFTCLDVVRSGRQELRARFQVPNGGSRLEWDLSGCHVGHDGFAPEVYRGFRFVDVRREASQVCIIDSRIVENEIFFALDREPEGPEGMLVAATQRNPAEEPDDDPAVNARTLLHDGTRDESLYIRGFIQSNWCQPFTRCVRL